MSETDSRPSVRVCLVGPSLDILGGQAIQAQRLLEGLRGSDIIDVTFLAVNPRLSGPLGALQRVKYIRTVVTTLVYAYSMCKRLPQVDVVHAFSASYFSYLLAPLPALVLAKLMGKATVLNYRSGEADDHLTRWRFTARPTMMRLADAIVVPSEYLVEVFARHGLRARAISNFVPIEQLPYRRRESLTPHLLSNRNLEPLYNVACILRAFAIIKRWRPDATLTIAGDGSQRGELERMVRSANLEGVSFVGRVPPEQIGQLYDVADVYLNSPNIDNMPGSIVEAFACGVPVVTTDAGGIPYIVEHGRTGLMVACNDHEALATSVRRLLKEPGLALELANAARAECAQRYVWAAVQSQWEALYGELHKGA